MDLFIPYGFTPYEGSMNYGIFSSRELAQKVLDEEKQEGLYETYDIYVGQLDNKDYF